jgi:hypothetical protein
MPLTVRLTRKRRPPLPCKLAVSVCVPTSATDRKRPCTRSRGAREEMASVRLQRWCRRVLLTTVWDMESATNVTRIWRETLIALVEPNGIEFCFQARRLALYFVSSGATSHPVTRRVLLPVELRRLQRLTPPSLSLLLRYTCLHAPALALLRTEQHSMRDFCHAQAGEALDFALECAEESDEYCSPRLHRALDEYEDSLLDSAQRFPETQQSLIQQHLALLTQRRHVCQREAWFITRDIIRDWSSRASNDTLFSRPAMFVSWLQS